MWMYIWNMKNIYLSKNKVFVSLFFQFLEIELILFIYKYV